MDATIAAVLTSTVVAALVSGVFGYLNGSRIEKVKAQLAAGQERAKRLGDAHVELLTIKTSGGINITAAMKDPTAALNALVIEMTEYFQRAESIYIRIRPLLAHRHWGEIDGLHKNADEINQRMSKRLRSEEEFDQNKALVTLLGAREKFIESLKRNVEKAYAEAAGA